LLKNKTVARRTPNPTTIFFVQGECKLNLSEFAEPQPKMAKAICCSIRDKCRWLVDKIIAAIREEKELAEGCVGYCKRKFEKI
jgi:hypothetical protein